MQTQIKIQRPTGEIEIVIKPGAIVSNDLRQRMIDATRNAGKGEIIGWTITGNSGPKLNIYQRLAQYADNEYNDEQVDFRK